MDMFDERKLLDYDTYLDYLDSFVRTDDLFYLRNRNFARMIAGLGYRSATDVLSKKQFHARKAAVQEALFPSRKPHILFSTNCESYDQFLQELATRERPNRVGMMTTIISMRHRQPNGVEISGFIDFEESLRKSILEFEEGGTDWYEIFKETKRICPTKDDLGYYNSNTGYSCINDTKNFKAITDPNQGLIFESRHDRQQIFVNPLSTPGSGTTRTIVDSEHYDHVVLYDHVVRNKI